MTISEKLKQARAESGLSQEEVAEKLGVSRQTMSNWENARSYPDIVSVIALSDIYNVALDSLMKGDTEMQKHLQESTNITKSNKQVAASIIALMLALLSTVGVIVVLGGELGDFADLPTLMFIVLPLLAVLTITRSFKLFSIGFKTALFPKRKVDEIIRANAARLYRLLSKTTALATLLNIIISAVNVLMGMSFEDPAAMMALRANVATILIIVVYAAGLIMFVFEPIAYILRRSDAS
ncbi:MAG: helix-turn-helix domain-containing protein [Oscillospiraceae bacterium]|nr:helix-turn-helix domain-containing protein [Oscillospiraceae bacterium]